MKEGDLSMELSWGFTSHNGNVSGIGIVGEQIEPLVSSNVAGTSSNLEGVFEENLSFIFPKHAVFPRHRWNVCCALQSTRSNATGSGQLQKWPRSQSYPCVFCVLLPSSEYRQLHASLSCILSPAFYLPPSALDLCIFTYMYRLCTLIANRFSIHV